MSKRKPLPYAANQRLDEICMDTAEGLRMLEPLLKGKDVETVSRVAIAVRSFYRIEKNVREIKEVQNANS